MEEAGSCQQCDVARLRPRILKEAAIPLSGYFFWSGLGLLISSLVALDKDVRTSLHNPLIRSFDQAHTATAREGRNFSPTIEERKLEHHYPQ